MLSNFTVLDFSSLGPGPRCTRLLADYGMRVLKIRPPRSGTRMLEPPWFGYAANRGIDQIHVDLKQREGLDLVKKMAAEADVVIESFRPGVAAKLGIGYEDLEPINSSIVYCSASGHGQEGPYADRPAHDLNWLAMCGYLELGGHRADGGPAHPGATVADTVGGYSAAVAILGALLARKASGRGRYLDVSVVDAVLRMMFHNLDSYLAGEGTPRPGDEMLTGGYACYDVYETQDGRWLAVGAIEPHFWAALCRGLGLAHRIPDQLDATRQAEVRAEVAAVFRSQPRAHWLTTLGAVACVSGVNTLSEVLDDPHLASRPLVRDVRLGDKAFRQMTPRLAISDPEDLDGQPVGPTPSARVDELLSALGIDSPQLKALREGRILT
jgi:alpha-methylacyl-CoA racemase